MSEQNQHAYESLQDALDAIPPHEIEACNANPTAASRRAIQGAEWLTRWKDREDRTMQDLLALLPEVLFKFQGPDHLLQLGLALRYTSTKLREEEANSTPNIRRLPPELAKPATEIRRRMVKVCEFYLGHLPHVQNTLNDIRSDRSYDTLDADLDSLALLYTNYKDIVSAPSPYFKFTDRADAEDLSRKIASFLDNDDNIRAWRIARNRVWTLLKREYNEARRGVFFVLKDNPNTAAESFPTLHSPFKSSATEPPQDQRPTLQMPQIQEPNLQETQPMRPLPSDNS